MNKLLVCLAVAVPSLALGDGRFTALDESRILDNATNLVWEQTGGLKEMTFREAENYCRTLAKSTGYHWRLPKVKELATLVDENSYNPSIYPIFQTQSRLYWSSTRNAADDDFAWLVNFSDSHIHSFRLYTKYYIRCTYAKETSNK